MSSQLSQIGLKILFFTDGTYYHDGYAIWSINSGRHCFISLKRVKSEDWGIFAIPWDLR